MVVIKLKYIQSIDVIDQFLVEHRNFLQSHYDQGHLLASGPMNPRVGGIIIALTGLEDAKLIIKADPFFINNVAEYEFIEFEPVKYHVAIKQCI